MKFIAVTQRVDIVSSYNERRDALDQRWTDFLTECKYVPFLLPNNKEAVEAMFSKFEVGGILLTGGNSLCEYGGNAKERDCLEMYLLEFSIRRKIPLIGVCRGMQVIQNFFGVSLNKIQNHVAISHNISLDGQTCLVNSYHDWGTSSSVPCLKIVATSADGIVESVRHEEYDIHGFMWHPERNNPFHLDDIRLFRTIFK